MVAVLPGNVPGTPPRLFANQFFAGHVEFIFQLVDTIFEGSAFGRHRLDVGVDPRSVLATGGNQREYG
jgi:hypothetical protein